MGCKPDPLNAPLLTCNIGLSLFIFLQENSFRGLLASADKGMICVFVFPFQPLLYISTYIYI